MPTALKFRTALLHTARLISDQVNQLLLPYQLNYSLWQVMYVLQLKHSCTSIEIAQYLNVSKPAIAKRIHTLNQLGLLEQLNSKDKREKKLRLNQQGQTLFTHCAKQIDELEQQWLEGIDASQLQHSLTTLHTLIARLEMPEQGANHV